MHALNDAGYTPNSTPSFQRNSMGCYIGVATGDYAVNLRNEIDVYYSTGICNVSYNDLSNLLLTVAKERSVHFSVGRFPMLSNSAARLLSWILRVLRRWSPFIRHAEH